MVGVFARGRGMVTQGGVAGSSAIGERDPQGVQRLPYPAGWDADVGFATTRADAWSSTSRTGRGARRGRDRFAREGREERRGVPRLPLREGGGFLGPCPLPTQGVEGRSRQEGGGLRPWERACLVLAAAPSSGPASTSKQLRHIRRWYRRCGCDRSLATEVASVEQCRSTKGAHNVEEK